MQDSVSEQHTTSDYSSARTLFPSRSNLHDIKLTVDQIELQNEEIIRSLEAVYARLEPLERMLSRLDSIVRKL